MVDIVAIIGNVSQSLYPLQRFITGGAYLLGITFFIIAIFKLKKVVDHPVGRPSQEKMFAPMMYILFGAMLLYLPTAMDVMSNTVFGTGNILAYTKLNPYDIYSSMGLLIRTAGILWFVRGCVLVAQASSPGAKEGPKGLLLLFAGVLAINFDNTVSIINSFLSNMITWTLAVKSSQGY
jgi:hypothetical protein